MARIQLLKEIEVELDRFMAGVVVVEVVLVVLVAPLRLEIQALEVMAVLVWRIQYRELPCIIAAVAVVVPMILGHLERAETVAVEVAQKPVVLVMELPVQQILVVVVVEVALEHILAAMVVVA